MRDTMHDPSPNWPKVAGSRNCTTHLFRAAEHATEQAAITEISRDGEVILQGVQG